MLDLSPIKKIWKEIPRYRIYSFLLFLVFAVWGLQRAMHRHWVCDDAFITYRYSLNLQDGLGAVFNEGEKVEGYTNFLWMLLLSIGLNFHLPPERLSQGLGIFSYLGSLLVLYLFSLKNDLSGKYKSVLPFASIALAIQPHAQIYATGGLETSFFGFLLVAGLSIVFHSHHSKHLFWGFLFLGLASLTRPEGFLFYFWASLYALYAKPGKGSPIDQIMKVFFYQLPLFFLVLPYIFWKIDYYGSFTPNTYWAKYGQGIYPRQGLRYIFLYLNSYYVFYIFFFVLLLKYSPDFLLEINNRLATKTREWKRSRQYRKMFQMVVPKKKKWEFHLPRIGFRTTPVLMFTILAIIPSLLYVIYLVMMGGDFMFARLLISFSGVFFLGMEMFLYYRLKEGSRIFFSILLLLSLPLYYNPYEGTKLPIIDGITEESSIYRINEVYRLKQILFPLRESFQNGNVHIAFSGSQAMYAYYMNPPYALEISTGLTDTEIARMGSQSRGRIGHERLIPVDYLYDRGIDILLFDRDLPGQTDYNLLRIKGIPTPFRILKYKKNTMKYLKKNPRLEFIDFEEYLDKYIENMDSYSTTKIKKDFREFNKYYFHLNRDPERKVHFLSIVPDRD